MSDLISRHAVLIALHESGLCTNNWLEVRNEINSIPSAEPRTDGVMCALADRECPFQGKEYAWCLTCPHISEEDRELVKKAVAEPKTGEWEYDPNGMDWNIPAWRCSECGYVASHIGISGKGIGSNPMNWAGSKYCPECGRKIVGARMRGEKE